MLPKLGRLFKQLAEKASCATQFYRLKPFDGLGMKVLMKCAALRTPVVAISTERQEPVEAHSEDG